MIRDVLGLLISYGFVFLVIGLSRIVSRFGKEASRKFVHVGVAHWWILAMIFFKTPGMAVIGPITFVLLNYLSYRFDLFSAMERHGGRGDLGTVYYALSLAILSWLTFGARSAPYVGAVGVLIMGYGDGFAAIVGQRYGRRKIHFSGTTRSLEGTLTMLGVSFAVCLTVLSICAPAHALVASLTVAVVATLAEALTPLGFDNLTVPLSASATYQLLFFAGSP